MHIHLWPVPAKKRIDGVHHGGSVVHHGESRFTLWYHLFYTFFVSSIINQPRSQFWLQIWERCENSKMEETVKPPESPLCVAWPKKMKLFPPKMDDFFKVLWMTFYHKITKRSQHKILSSSNEFDGSVKESSWRLLFLEKLLGEMWTRLPWAHLGRAPGFVEGKMWSNNASESPSMSVSRLLVKILMVGPAHFLKLHHHVSNWNYYLPNAKLQFEHFLGETIIYHSRKTITLYNMVFWCLVQYQDMALAGNVTGEQTITRTITKKYVPFFFFLSISSFSRTETQGLVHLSTGSLWWSFPRRRTNNLSWAYNCHHDPQSRSPI